MPPRACPPAAPAMGFWTDEELFDEEVQKEARRKKEHEELARKAAEEEAERRKKNLETVRENGSNIVCITGNS